MEVIAKWDAKPIFSKEYKERKERIDVDKEPIQTTDKGTIRTGDFIFYVQNKEQYARAALTVEDVSLLARAIDMAIADIYHGLNKEVKVFSTKKKSKDGKTEIIDIRTTVENRFKIYIRHGEHWAIAHLELSDASWLALVLNYEAVAEYITMSNTQQKLWAEIKDKLTGKSKKRADYDSERMTYV